MRKKRLLLLTRALVLKPMRRAITRQWLVIAIAPRFWGGRRTLLPAGKEERSQEDTTFVGWVYRALASPVVVRWWAVLLGTNQGIAIPGTGRNGQRAI